MLLGIIAPLTRKYALDPTKILSGLIIFAITLGYVQTFVFDMNYRHIYWRIASILLDAMAFLFLNAKRSHRMLQTSWTPVVFTVAGFALQLNAAPTQLSIRLGQLASPSRSVHLSMPRDRSCKRLKASQPSS